MKTPELEKVVARFRSEINRGFERGERTLSNWFNVGELVLRPLFAELSTLRAENERLRERCEAATFVRYGNVSFQKSLMSGKWIVFRDHHEVTEYLAGDGRESFGNAYADTIDAGWLRDSNNKGGGYRESALTPQQEPGK